MDDEKTENINKPSTSISQEIPVKDNTVQVQESRGTTVSRTSDVASTTRSVVVYQRARNRPIYRAFGARRRNCKKRSGRVQKRRQVRLNYKLRKAAPRRRKTRSEDSDEPSTSVKDLKQSGKHSSTTTATESSICSKHKNSKLGIKASQTPYNVRGRHSGGPMKRPLSRLLNDRLDTAKRTRNHNSVCSMMSSGSDCPCEYCEKKRYRRYRSTRLANPPTRSRAGRYAVMSARVQVGSPSLMLSRLMIAAGVEPGPQPDPSATYCTIDQEMISNALKQLGMWKQAVPTKTILEYIAKRYPVNPNKEELMEELLKKLQVASTMGMVNAGVNGWSAELGLKKRTSMNHVSQFWERHNTMGPATKKDPEPKKNPIDEKKDLVQIHQDYI